jgi:hypothetical protein
MILNKILLYLVIFVSFNGYSQEIFKEYGSREYSDTLNIQLLQKVCDNLEIKFSDIFTDKSHSTTLDSDKTFFAIQYILRTTQDGNLYTTKYLFADNATGQVIDQVDDKEFYYREEAVRLSPSYILKKPIQLSENISGISVISEESAGSCATLYSQQRISIFILTKNKIKEVMKNYPIRKTQGESNCSGSYEIEILEKSVALMKGKTNGFFDLMVTKTFTYENVADENSNPRKTVKNKTETEKLTFDGINYNFKKDESLRFLNY